MLANFNWAEAIGESPIFLTLVVCSVITLSIAVERAIYYWKHRANPDAALIQILEKVRSGDLRAAMWACAACSHPLGSVATRVLESADEPADVAEERLMIALSEQKLTLERNLPALGSMAAIAPLVGLLGTVWGIMRAFQDMAVTGSAAPSIVAGGVAEALTTTAAGLVVAVPAVVLYNHFIRRMNVMLTVAENHSRSVRNALRESRSEHADRDATGGANRRAA